MEVRRSLTQTETKDICYSSNMSAEHSPRSTQSFTEMPRSKRAYQHIELWKRKELVECVSKRDETMKDCSKRLGINYCTAKHILKIFRRTGSFETDLMKKKKEKEDELRQRVLNDSQFADYAMKEYNNSCENIKQTQSGHSSTKDIGEIQNYENSYENYYPSMKNCCNDYEREGYVMNSQGVYPVQVQAYYCNPNYLFGCNEINTERFGQFDQRNLYHQVPDVCAYLGDLVYAKHSIIDNSF